MGIKIIQRAPIIVEGIESSGIVIPITTPNSLSALSLLRPKLTSLRGIIIARIGWSKLPNNLTRVNGKLLLMISL